MQTKEENIAEQSKRGEQHRKRKPQQYPEDLRKRLNPRLVFTDPFEFFQDLLMEQQEQQ